jgi:alkanesulfonate monooxygenase
MVAGGFTNDLAALGDRTPHDLRYERLTEYTLILQELLSSERPVTFNGRFYDVQNLKLVPALPPSLMPDIFVSGSSEAGLRAAQTIGAITVEYPKPAGEAIGSATPDQECGIRIGIIAKKSSAEAWHTAHTRFPEDRKGQIKHQLAMGTSDSAWHRQLSCLTDDDIPDSPYWLVPFQNYGTFCPYLVGSFETVAAEIRRYLSNGYTNFILDIPRESEDLAAARTVFEIAAGAVVQ